MNSWLVTKQNFVMLQNLPHYFNYFKKKSIHNVIFVLFFYNRIKFCLTIANPPRDTTSTTRYFDYGNHARLTSVFYSTSTTETGQFVQFCQGENRL